MGPICSSEKVSVCQTCGDEGFTNAFVYCVRCLDFVIHRYCLSVMPRTFDELVIWYCERCKPTVRNQDTSPKVKSSQSQKEEAASPGHVKATHPKKKPKKERAIASLIAGTEEVDYQEKTTEPDGECISPTDFLKEALVKSNLRHKEITSRVVAGTEEGISLKRGHAHHLPKKDCTNRKKDASCLAAKKKEHKIQNGLKNGSQKACTKMADSIKHSWNGISPTATDLKNKKGVVYSLEEQIDESQPSQPPYEHEKLISDASSMKKESDKTSNHECEAETANKMQTKQDIGTNVSQIADFKNSLQHNYYRHAQPVIHPVWRGSFSILHTDYDLFEGFVAHLSNNACDKVYEEANMLPSLLCIEMHPKTVLWPKSFQEREPSDDNIALYFFPGDPINERAFDHLVRDMMYDGLAMRTTAKNAELLIFTSTVLPPLFWRFQGKYYLWGVFRRKRDGSMPVASHDLTVSNNSDKSGLSKDSPYQVNNVKKILMSVKTLDACSPQSSLSSNGENGVDMDPESGD